MEEYRLLPAAWEGWKITELLGSGAYGSVYEAVRGTDGEEEYCAIKILDVPQQETTEDAMVREYGSYETARSYYEGMVQDFRREIELMQRLNGQKHIVSLLDYQIVEKTETFGWTIYIQMELLQQFSEYTVYHKMDEAEAIRLGIQICDALEMCEELKIIHRDIKPDNILVTQDGTYKLADFGVARHMDQTMGMLSVKGTPTYIAPEVYHGEAYDRTVDQYSLGIVLYKLLNNNREPFIDAGIQILAYSDREKAMERRLSGEPIPELSDVSDGFNEIILKACSYAPGDRYKSAAELRTDLEALQAGTYKLKQKTAVTRAAKKVNRFAGCINRKVNKKVLWVAAAVGCVAAFMGGFFLIREKKKSDTSAEEFQSAYTSKMDVELLNNQAWELQTDTMGQLLNAFANEDTAAFTKLTSLSGELYEPCRILAGDPYTEQRIEGNLIGIGPDDCLSEIFFYRIKKSQELNNHEVEVIDIPYLIHYENGEWTQEAADGEMREKLIEAVTPYYPQGYQDAVAAGRNHMLLNSLIWLQEEAMIEGEMSAAPHAVWQNEDGKISFLVSAKNGTGEEKTINHLSIRLTQQIADGSSMDIVTFSEDNQYKVKPGETINYIFTAPWNQFETLVWNEERMNCTLSFNFTPDEPMSIEQTERIL